MSTDSILYLGLAAGFIGLMSTWFFAVVTCPLVRRLASVRRHFPSAFWFGIGVVPWIIGLSFLGFSAASGLLSVGGWLADHCPLHKGHPHLCLAHIAQSPPGGAILWLVLLAGGFWIVYQGGRLHFSGRRKLARLSETSQPNGEYHLVPSQFAAAFTTGILHPRIYLTTRAVRLLRTEERRVVLAHEQAHLRRRDPLCSSILALSEKCFPSMKAIRRRWLLAVETECDRAAVEAGFAETLVAGTILKLKRANQSRLAHAAFLHYSGADDDALRTRLRVLLSDPECDTWVRSLWILLPIFWLMSALFFPEIHHAMETFLGWLC